MRSYEAESYAYLPSQEVNEHPTGRYPVADEHLIAALGLITRLGRYPLRTLDALHLATADKTMADAGQAAGLGIARFF